MRILRRRSRKKKILHTKLIEIEFSMSTRRQHDLLHWPLQDPRKLKESAVSLSVNAVKSGKDMKRQLKHSMLQWRNDVNWKQKFGRTPVKSSITSNSAQPQKGLTIRLPGNPQDLSSSQSRLTTRLRHRTLVLKLLKSREQISVKGRQRSQIPI